VFLTRKFKEKNKHYILKTFLNAMIKNIKIHNIIDINEISKSMEPNIYIYILNYENVHLNIFYEFFKV